MLEAAQKSPVYRFVKEWRLALPLHPEFRTLPMLFYVPSLTPIMASVANGLYDLKESLFGTSITAPASRPATLPHSLLPETRRRSSG